MITEEQKQDILLTVNEKFGEWLQFRCDMDFNGFELIYKEIFQPSGFDIDSLKKEPPIKVLDAIISCCDKLKYSNNQKWCALNAAASDANEIYGIQLLN